MKLKVKFLGMTIIAATIAISAASMKRAMAKGKELTPRGAHVSLESAIDQINKWYVGWSEYYRMTQDPSQLKKIETHVRRRLRSRLVDQQKKCRYLFKKLIKRGVRVRSVSKAVFSNKARWVLSNTYAVNRAYPNR